MAQYTGKANKRRVLRWADAMAQEAIAHFPELPGWAGIGWIISPYYNCRAGEVCRAMGDAWTARARRILAALDYATLKR